MLGLKECIGLGKAEASSLGIDDGLVVVPIMGFELCWRDGALLCSNDGIAVGSVEGPLLGADEESMREGLMLPSKPSTLGASDGFVLGMADNCSSTSIGNEIDAKSSESSWREKFRVGGLSNAPVETYQYPQPRQL